MARLATKAGVNGELITLHTPLLYHSKADTIRLGVDLGVDYALTVTCYRANDAGEACGCCDACEGRRQGFAAAKIEDPTRYSIHSEPASAAIA